MNVKTFFLFSLVIVFILIIKWVFNSLIKIVIDYFDRKRKDEIQKSMLENNRRRTFIKPLTLSPIMEIGEEHSNDVSPFLTTKDKMK